MSAIKAQLIKSQFIKSLKSEIKAAGLKFSAQNRMKLRPKKVQNGRKKLLPPTGKVHCAPLDGIAHLILIVAHSLLAS